MVSPTAASLFLVGVGFTLSLATPSNIENEFIQRQGMHFVAGGQPHFVVSANYWQAMNLGAVDSSFGNRTRLRQDLDKFVQLGINNLRIMASSEGPDDSPFRMSPTLLKAPGIYDEAIFEGLDFALAEMSARKIKAVMCLNNEWHWSGGFSQYVSWLTNSTIPYPPSWSPSLNNYTATGDYSKFVPYSNRFYEDSSISSKAQTLYKNHIRAIMTRKNKFNGRIYKDDPTIFSWQLANEPQNPPRSWVNDTASFIKSISPQHLVSVGLESKNDEAEFLSAHQSEYIDYATIHVWAQNRGVYDMLNSSKANLDNTIQWGTEWLTKVDQWNLASFKKPLILEEFGLARDNWQASDSADWYNPKHTTNNRDTYYKAMLTTAAKSYQKNGSYSGFGFWAYAGAARPGDRFISDPPHEAPGWYAVYDTDVSTHQIIQSAIPK